MKHNVALVRAGNYDAGPLKQQASEALSAAGVELPSRGTVLVKPNLVGAKEAALACTHPAVVRAVAELAVDAGCRVTVADSPAFGSGKRVALKVGYGEALAGLPVTIAGLAKPVAVKLPSGLTAKISATALEADLVLGVPKLKAHQQLRITAAVKNLFGCVVGGRKALAHFCHGDKGDTFRALLLEVAQIFPRQAHVLDGITAMHVSGPLAGEAYDLGLLAAAQDPVALDTAVYTILGLESDFVPLWELARTRSLPGTDPADLAFPIAGPTEFDAANFVIPKTLAPETFDPYRLLKGRLKSLRERL